MYKVFLSILLFSFSVFSEVRFDIAYGEHQKQKVDYYPGDDLDTLVWIHGGGWMNGDKNSINFVQRFAVGDPNIFSIGYRLGYGTAPNAANDALCAYQMIEHILIKEGKSSRDVTVIGLSAGGHLALLVGMLNSTEKRHDCKSRHLPKAIVNVYGITEIEMTERYLYDRYNGPQYPTQWVGDRSKVSKISKEFSPLYMVNDNNPPIVTIHGTADYVVPYEQATILHDKLTVRNKLITIPGKGHGDFSREEWGRAIRNSIKFINEDLDP